MTDTLSARSPQLTRFETASGFIAALDQSGGSTPDALKLYGIEPSDYAGEAEMFDLIHAARVRIITSPVFTSDRIIGAILFDGTLDREIDGRRVADYLLQVKGILPFVKIDKGLEPEQDGVQLMRDIPALDELLASAVARGACGTKERSVIHAANPSGIAAVVAQQFAVADRVLAAGMIPILEPEVSIEASDKREAEVLLKAALLSGLEGLGERTVAVKVTIPTVDGFYSDLVDHPNVARVVALSGGYSRQEASARLARNPGLIASFSRALLDGLTVQQDEAEFNATLDAAIEPIYRASLS